MDKTVTLPVRAVEAYDVVVVGGGTTGCCAALAASRQGVRVALVEREGFVGGTATCGLPWMAFVDQQGRPFVGGIPLEILERLRAMDGASAFHLDPICGSTVWVDGTLLKVVLLAMLEEAGVTIALHTSCVAVEKADERLTGVYVMGAGGCRLLTAQTVIDSTDSGCVAALAGADYTHGRELDGRVQASSQVVMFGNLDTAAMIAYFRANPRQMRPFSIPDAALSELVSRLDTAPCIVLARLRP